MYENNHRYYTQSIRSMKITNTNNSAVNRGAKRATLTHKPF